MVEHDVEQGSPEWFEVRKGKMTASKATAIGNYGKGLETYIIEMMAESMSSGEKDGFKSKDTERGNLYEPIARKVYALETGLDVRQVGFIEYNEFVGCSPDGLMDLEDGGLEIKCPDDTKYFKYLLNGEEEIDSGYIWQIQMNLLITGRKWWDLVIYNPNYSKSMLIYRILPDQEKFKELLVGFKKGAEKIIEIKEKIKSYEQ